MKNKRQFLLQVLNILICILILTIAIFYFGHEQAQAILFPLLFILGAVLSFTNGINFYRSRKIAIGIAFFVLMGILLVIALYSYLITL